MKNSIKIVFLILVFASASICSYAQKVGHINFVELIQSMPETATANKQLEDLTKVYEDEIETLEVELRNKYVTYESNRATMADTTAARVFDELDQLSQKVETRKGEVEQEFQSKQDGLLEPIFKKAQETIDKVAKANGVACIFNTQALMYIDPTTGFDLLPLVKQDLGIQ